MVHVGLDRRLGDDDQTLEVAGVLGGAAAAALVKVRRSADGSVTTTAMLGYAVLWIAVIGGRCAFAYGSEHWFPEWIRQFSIDRHLTGSDAWTAAFVMMALSMVVTRVVLTGVVALVVRARGEHALAA
jgi:hypothetical protein